VTTTMRKGRLIHQQRSRFIPDEYVQNKRVALADEEKRDGTLN